MRFKLTFILLILNLALGAAIYYLEMKTSAIDPWAVSERKVFSAGTIEACDSIRVAGKNLEESWLLERDAKGWKITSPIQWPANFNAVTQITNELQFLSWERKFSVSDLTGGESLADYGLADLENPMASITVRHNSNETTILIGDATRVGNNLYILSDDRSEVMVVNRELFKKISIELEKLRSQTIFDMPHYEIKSLSMEFSTGNKVMLTKKGGMWAFDLPIKTEANSAEVSILLSRLTGMNVVSFIDSDLVNQGLDKPSARITLEAQNGRRQTLLIGKPVEQAATPAAGEQPRLVSNTYFAKLEGENPSIFTAPAQVIEDLKKAQTTLRERHFVPLDPRMVTAIDIAADDQVVTLQKLENGGWQVFQKGNEGDLTTVAADVKVMAEMMLNIANLEAVAFIDDAPSEAMVQKYIHDDTKLKVTIKGAEETALFIGHSDSKYYAKLDSADSIYEVKPNTILPFVPAKLLYYRRRVLEELPASASVTGVQLEDLSSGRLLYDITIDPLKETFYTKLEDGLESDRDAILNLIDAMKKFSVKKYIKEDFQEGMFQLGGINMPWNYRLTGTVNMPPIGDQPQEKKVIYYFTKRLGGTTQYGGSPEYELTFSMQQSLIDAVKTLTLDKEPPEPIKADDGKANVPPDA